MGVLLLVLLTGASALADDTSEVECEEPEDACPQPLDDAEVIVVTGLGQEEEASRAVHHTRVLSGEALRRDGVQSVADALEVAPGVQIVDGVGGEGVSLQGMDPEHTLILVDGVRVGGRVSGTLDLRRLPVSDIEQIEIVEGPSATLYGSDAMAGVIHIRTRRARPETRSEVRLVAGRFASTTRPLDESIASAVPLEPVDTLDASASLSGGSETARGRVQAGWSAAEASDATPDDPGTSVNAYRQARISATGDLDLSEKHTLTAEARWQSYRRWGADALPTGAVLDRTNLTSEWGLGLGDRVELDERKRLRVKVGARGWTDQYRVDQRGADTQDAYQRTVDVLGQGRVQYDTLVGQRHVLAVGAEVLGERLTADRIDPKTVDRVRVAAFAQERWDPTGTDAWAVEAAARADYDSRFGAYLTPRAGVRWAPSTTVLARLSGGRGFRAPDFREMFLVFENAASGYRVDGNADLRPETSWNLQGGLELRPTAALQLGLRGFHNDLIDLIQADLIDAGGPGEAQRFGYVNINSARTTGLEVDTQLDDVDVGRVSLMYRYTDSLDRQTGLPLSGRARHQVTGSGLLRLPALRSRASVRGSWLGSRSFVSTVDSEPVATQAPAVLALDATWIVAPHERLDVLLGVENLLDAGSEPSSLYQTRPRRVFVGLTGRLGAVSPGAP